TRVNKLAKLKAMSGAERRWLLQAWLLLPVVSLFLRGIGLRQTQGLLVTFVGRLAVTEIERQQARALADTIARLVSSASRYSLVGANCLPQALVLWLLLRRSGISSELRIGVRKESDKFEAHAWVELFGLALNNQTGVERRYTPFEASILPPEVRLP
ncbi:MAG: lasso peptide biosynthesis B2 protein, partial [Blastocatellia bacterium]